MSGGFFRAVYLQFLNDGGVKTSHIKRAFASQEPQGRDLEVGDEKREPSGLERAATFMVFAHGGEIPVIQAVVQGKRFDPTDKAVGDETVKRLKEAGHDIVVIFRQVHKHRLLTVHNSFPAERRHGGRRNRYVFYPSLNNKYYNVKQQNADTCIQVCICTDFILTCFILVSFEHNLVTIQNVASITHAFLIS